MIQGAGIDLVSLREFDSIVGDSLSYFLDRHFTATERDYCEKRAGPPLLHLAGHYAAKEAMIKALDSSHLYRPALLPKIDYREIEVIHDPQGRPSFHFSGKIRQLMADLQATPFLSISHDGDYAVAQVILA